MSVRNVISFAVAIVVGLVALFIVRGYLAVQGGARAAPTPALTSIVVASTPISRGATLKPEMLKIAKYPRESVPQGAFTTVDQVMRGPDGAARSAVRDMVANEPVVPTKVSGPDSRPNLSGALAPGTRAVSVKSSDVAGVGGFVLPGDRVDVLATRQIGKGEQATSLVQVLAENVRVMGVDQSSDADEPTVAKAVTIEVTPDQAQSISLAQAVGMVSLALRQVNDATPLERRATTVADLGPGRATVSRRAASPRRYTPAANVRVTRGVEVASYAIN